jgi:hypothetical protein
MTQSASLVGDMGAGDFVALANQPIDAHGIAW